MNLSLERNDQGESVLTLKTCAEIENFFKTATIGTSEGWGENRFYSRFSNSDEFQGFLQSINSRDNYGGQPFYNGRLNFSVLRTVGISQDFVKIPLGKGFTEETMKAGTEGFKSDCIRFYKQFIRPVKIKCIISEEMTI